MTQILFVHNETQSFVHTDLALLQERWQVQERYELARRINPLAVFRAVQQSSLVFCWFASWHSLLPVIFARLLRKPSVVVVGGYDTANLPEANYGSQRGGIRRWLARAVIHNATCLLVNSYSARDEAITNAAADPEKITVMYHGVEPVSMGNEAREPLVLTVGGVWQENFLRKGLLPFVQAAARLPDIPFVLVGKWMDQSIDELRAQASSNVQFTGYLSDEEIEAMFMRAAVYVQASLHEGFGLSVAEAMTAGCIPVVTSVGSLPEVVGETGVYLDSNEPAEIATCVERALAFNGNSRQQARERVVTKFPMEQRRDALHSLIMTLLH